MYGHSRQQQAEATTAAVVCAHHSFQPAVNVAAAATDLRRAHGVVCGEEEFEMEDAAFVRRVWRTLDDDTEVPEVVFVRSRHNARH